jgi:hypothetical protein
MRTRSPIKYIIESLKNDGAEIIIPSSTIRFVTENISELPRDWESQDFEGLVNYPATSLCSDHGASTI